MEGENVDGGATAELCRIIGVIQLIIGLATISGGIWICLQALENRRPGSGVAEALIFGWAGGLAGAGLTIMATGAGLLALGRLVVEATRIRAATEWSVKQLYQENRERTGLVPAGFSARD